MVGFSGDTFSLLWYFLTCFLGLLSFAVWAFIRMLHDRRWDQTAKQSRAKQSKAKQSKSESMEEFLFYDWREDVPRPHVIFAVTRALLWTSTLISPSHAASTPRLGAESEPSEHVQLESESQCRRVRFMQRRLATCLLHS